MRPFTATHIRTGKVVIVLEILPCSDILHRPFGVFMSEVDSKRFHTMTWSDFREQYLFKSVC